MVTFTLNGKSIKLHQILNNEYDPDTFDPFELKTFDFIKNWLSGKSEFTFSTSGSTGIPKEITFHRSLLQKSALRTNRYFGLTPGSTILSCLNTDFVAGKMMLVRALVGDLNMLIETPSSNPLFNIPKNKIIDFVALTPIQIDCILKETSEKLAQIKTILLGGAGLEPMLENKLQKIKTKIFHSYAMTETLTHVALRKVNGVEKSSFFHALPEVTFAQDKRNCLIVTDHLLEIDRLVTNDIVDLIDEGTFRWIGRYDNVINSGGIKIQLEETEIKIKQILKENGIDLPVCLLSLPDNRLGNKMMLLIASKDTTLEEEYILNLLKAKLPKFHDPKRVKIVRELIMTNSGKIDRIANRIKYLSENITNEKNANN